MLKSVSKVISQFAEFSVKLIVAASKSGQESGSKPLSRRHYISIWDNNNQLYVNFSYVSYFQIDYNKFGQTYDRNKRFIIHISQIPKLMRALNKMKYLLDTEFDNIYQEDGKSLYMDPDHKYTIIENGFMGNVSIMIRPSLINNINNDTIYQAIEFNINNTNNTFSMTMDEFLALIYIISKTDFYTMSDVIMKSALLVSKSGNYYDINYTTAQETSGYVRNDFNSQMMNRINNSIPQQSMRNIFNGLKES